LFVSKKNNDDIVLKHIFNLNKGDNNKSISFQIQTMGFQLTKKKNHMVFKYKVCLRYFCEIGI
jgi:hypothetical protein